MQKKILNFLKCPICENSSFKPVIEKENSIEIREGFLVCNNCQTKFKIKEGVLDLLINPSLTVIKQKEGLLKHDCNPWGLPFKVEDKFKYEKQILSLPEGDGGDFFIKETSFRSISESASMFYRALYLLKLTGKEKILDLGAGICWTTNKFAEIGCWSVALDISHHLFVSDVYIYTKIIFILKGLLLIWVIFLLLITLLMWL